jgi:steroid delta-isomerase-like uncharacterized protein
MSSEENIELVKRWFREVWNEGRNQTVHDLLAPKAVAKGQTISAADIHGPEEFVNFVKGIRSAFPDINVTIEDVFGAGDKVVARWSATMTHSGDGLGLAATGKKVRLNGITIARIKNGQIVEGWDNWDQLPMLRQIGAYEPPGSVPLEKSA